MARKLIFTDRLKVDCVEVPIGDPEPGKVRARTRISGISHGTEMAALTAASPFVDKLFTGDRVFVDKKPGEYPFFPFWYAGYDAVGVVDAVGEGVSNYRVGDRVWHPAFHQSEFLFDASSTDTFVLPQSVPDDEAIMLNLVSISLGAIIDAQIKLGDVVVVFGAGVVGQLAAQMALLDGARRVFLVEPSPERREMATRHAAVEAIDPGANLPALQVRSANAGQWPDVVIECSGNVKGLQSAIQCAGVAGTVVAAGFYAGGEGLRLSEEFLHNRVTLRASMNVWGCPTRYPERWDRPRLLRQSLHLLESRRLNLGGFVSHHFPFTQAQQAYDAIRREPGKYLKAALTYQD